MFDEKRPPILVIPLASQHIREFDKHSGFHNHPYMNNNMLVSFGDGWTFPVSVRKKDLISEPPLMLVRNSGGVTSESSRSRSGYAHHFVREDGSEPDSVRKLDIFHKKTDEEWMLIPDTVNVVWLQFTTQNQYLGNEGSDMIQYQYGRLIILNLRIVVDVAPSLDRKADIPEMHDMQYRVKDQQLFNTSWSMTDIDSASHLSDILTECSLDRYKDAVDIALHRAGFK